MFLLWPKAEKKVVAASSKTVKNGCMILSRIDHRRLNWIESILQTSWHQQISCCCLKNQYKYHIVMKLAMYAATQRPDPELSLSQSRFLSEATQTFQLLMQVQHFICKVFRYCKLTLCGKSCQVYVYLPGGPFLPKATCKWGTIQATADQGEAESRISASTISSAIHLTRVPQYCRCVK